MTPPVLAVIPARYASSRFPGKPLVEIQGKPMIAHVWERVSAVPQIARVIVATDDPRIAEAVAGFGGECRMTSPAHPSGTDRVWEVARTLPEYEWVLNVQGDEPFLNPVDLGAVIDGLAAAPDADIFTLVTPIAADNAFEFEDPNAVKAAWTLRGEVLYFSRSPIPCHRDGLPPAGQGSQAVLGYRHLGLYLFRREALARFTALAPSPLERTEKLEQLRALENGMRIFAAVVAHAPVGVDTPADLARLGA